MNLSVLLPAYNAEQTIEVSVKSILKQTYRDFELIIINDGSSDKTGNILDQLSKLDPRIRIITQSNCGLVETLNLGIKTAKYEFIARMDADDVAYPSRFYKQINHLNKNPKVAALGAAIQECDSNLNPVRTIKLPTDAENVRQHLLKNGNALAHPTVIFRKSIVSRVGGYSSYFKDAEDYALWLRLSEEYLVENLNEVLLDYRRSENTVSSINLRQQIISDLCARELANKGLLASVYKSQNPTIPVCINDLKLLGIDSNSVQTAINKRKQYENEISTAKTISADKKMPRNHKVNRTKRKSQKPSSNHSAQTRIFQEKFSILIPAYNHEEYIIETVESALSSPLVSEILIVDDGSKDRTPEMVKNLSTKHSRIHDLTIPGEGNKGTAYRLNSLVRQSKNNLVALLNSDDLFIHDRFERVLPFFKEGYDFVFGDLLIIDKTGKVSWAKRGPFTTDTPYPDSLDILDTVQNGDILTLLTHQNFAGTTSNFVFTKNLFEKVGGFSDFTDVNDWDFLLKCCLNGSVKYFQEYLTCYRFHETNTINESKERTLNEVSKLFSSLKSNYSDRFSKISEEFINSHISGF